MVRRDITQEVEVQVDGLPGLQDRIEDMPPVCDFHGHIHQSARLVYAYTTRTPAALHRG